MSIASHRAALVALLVADDVRAFDYAPKALPTPCVVVGFPSTYEAHDSMTTAGMTLPLSLYVGYGDNRAAEDEIEALIDSVVASVEGDDAYAAVEVRDFGLVENASGAPTALSCTIEVAVL